MASRRAEDLHPELARRWALAAAEYVRVYPDLPTPFLTCTYRDSIEQDKLYSQGRTDKTRPLVTNARAGESLHNYRLAFDIAFKDKNGDVDWSADLFEKFAGIAKKYELAWGGDWKSGFKDAPHFEPPNFTWHDAKAGREPVFPDLPEGQP